MLFVVRVGSRLVRLCRFKGINSLCVGLSHAMAIYNRVEPPRVATRFCGIPISPHILCSIFNEECCGGVSWKCRRLANPRRRYYRKQPANPIAVIIQQQAPVTIVVVFQSRAWQCGGWGDWIASIAAQDVIWLIGRTMTIHLYILMDSTRN